MKFKMLDTVVLEGCGRRYWLTKVAVAMIAACSPSNDRAPAPTPVERPAEWVAQHAASIRTIDPSDVEFSDLAPIANAARDARMILLGEAMHHEVPTSLAKARLVRFFHERMGFDVLVFEAGLWDCAQMEQALLAGAPLDEAIALGMFGKQPPSGRLRPVIAYARETQATSRPLVLAGFDPQFSGILRGEAYPGWLLAFFDRAGPGRITAEQRAALSRAFSRFPKKGKFCKLSPEERAEDRTAIAGLLSVLRAGAADLGVAHGEHEVAFVERTLLNVLSLYDWHAAVRADLSETVDWLTTRHQNVRDKQAADNVRWLGDERYRGRKLLVWAHNGHIARDVSAVDIPGGKYTYEGYRPMGSWLAKALGQGVYSLAFTSLEGTTVPAESIEGMMGATGQPYLFLDYRAPGIDPLHWLHGKRIARPTGYGDAVADWTEVFDGVFFIRAMSTDSSLKR